jgi:hypothetical protein
LLAQLQLTPSILALRKQRISANVYVQLFAQGLAQSGDDSFGLHLGEAVRPGYYSALDALHRQARYAEPVGSLGRVELNDEPPQADLEA